MGRPIFIRVTAENGRALLVPVKDLAWLSTVEADDPSGEQRRHHANGARTRAELRGSNQVAYFQEDIDTVHYRIRKEKS